MTSNTLNTMLDRRTMLKMSALGGAGLVLGPRALMADDPPEPTQQLKRYFIFPSPDGSNTANVFLKGLMMVDIDAGRVRGRWEVSHVIEVPALSKLRGSYGSGVRGATACAATNCCYVFSHNPPTLSCINLITGKVVYERDTPSLGRPQVNPDGTALIAGHYGLANKPVIGNASCIIDPATGTVMKQFDEEYGESMMMGPSGRFFYTQPPINKKKKEIHVIDVKTFKIVNKIIPDPHDLDLVGNIMHMQIDKDERYICVYCRLKVLLGLIDVTSGAIITHPPMTRRELWPDVAEHLGPKGKGSNLLRRAVDLPTSLHHVGYHPDGKRAWFCVEGNEPSAIEFDWSVMPPKPLRVVIPPTGPQCGKGYCFISRRGDVFCDSCGNMFDAVTGKHLGEIVYPNGRQIKNSKTLEANIKNGKVVFGSSDNACGYPPEKT